MVAMGEWRVEKRKESLVTGLGLIGCSGIRWHPNINARMDDLDVIACSLISPHHRNAQVQNPISSSVDATDTSLTGKGLDSKNEGADSTHVTNQLIPQAQAPAAPLRRPNQKRNAGTHRPLRTR
jgi:hypothetical protein